jgi:hypothetical protein
MTSVEGERKLNSDCCNPTTYCTAMYVYAELFVPHYCKMPCTVAAQNFLCFPQTFLLSGYLDLTIRFSIYISVMRSGHLSKFLFAPV